MGKDKKKKETLAVTVDIEIKTTALNTVYPMKEY